MSKEVSSSSVASGGIGFGGLLFLLFLTLKLTHVIDWSWWWVTAPLWIPVALVVGILAISVVILAISVVILAISVVIAALFR